MAEKDKMNIASFEGKAADFKTTEVTKVNEDTGEITEKVTYDVKVHDANDHSVNLRSGTSWDIRPGETVRIRVDRTQSRLDEKDEDKD